MHSIFFVPPGPATEPTVPDDCAHVFTDRTYLQARWRPP